MTRDYSILLKPSEGDPNGLLAPCAPASWRLRGDLWTHGWTCGPSYGEETPVSWQMSDGSTDAGQVETRDLCLRLVHNGVIDPAGMGRLFHVTDVSFRLSEFGGVGPDVSGRSALREARHAGEALGCDVVCVDAAGQEVQPW